MNDTILTLKIRLCAYWSKVDLASLPFIHLVILTYLEVMSAGWLNKLSLAYILLSTTIIWHGFPGGSVVKNLPANAGDARDVCSIPGWGRFPGEGNGTPLQYSCLENSMNRGAWRATVHGVTKSQTGLNTQHYMEKVSSWELWDPDWRLWNWSVWSKTEGHFKKAGSPPYGWLVNCGLAYRQTVSYP